MLLAVDIGNTSIKFAIFDGDVLLSRSSVPAKREYSNDEILRAVGDSLDLPIGNALVCSVVPELNDTVALLIAKKCGVEARFVENTMDLGLKISYEPLSAAGTDRLVNSFAASKKYGVPCIICSFGTATTIDAVSSQNELLGGMITLGIASTAEALRQKASQLPEVTIEAPTAILGNTTIESIRSGVVLGHAAMIDSLVRQISDGMDGDPMVVATGGFGGLMGETANAIDAVDDLLLLEGLNLLFKRLYTDTSNEPKRRKT